MKDPVYLTVARSLENDIKKGIYKSKDKLPSERQLSQLFNVSRMTARQAVLYIEEKGLVYRERGSGTYVSGPSIMQDNAGSFTETLSQLGYTVKTKIIEFSTVHHLTEICEKMDLPENTYFYKLKRLRRGDDVPMAVETLYIPKLFLPKLEEQDLSQSFYKLLEEKYNINILKLTYDMEAIIANPIHMEMMEMKKAAALLKVTGICYDQQKRKLLYEESIYRSELYKYHVDVIRHMG